MKMLRIYIPGDGTREIEHLVLDYNGTIAVDGVPIDGVVERLERLAEALQVHVVTADTFGSVRRHLAEKPFTVQIIRSDGQEEAKREYVRALGPRRACAIGNGRNDHLMLKEASIGIALIQREGAFGDTLRCADLIFASINDALDSLLDPRRMIASLRR
jgi:soluble P-type ATPase